MRSVTGFPRVLYFVRAFPLSLTRVPLWARGATGAGATFRHLLDLVLLLKDFWLGDGLDGLHHACGVHLGADAWPGKGSMVQIAKNSRIVVTSSLPGKGGVVLVGGEHGSELHEVKEVLESADELGIRHGRDLTLARC